MDNRIFTPLLPALKPGDWRELLTPVNELMLDTPDPICYYRPENCPQKLNTNLFMLGDHLIDARYSTDTTLKNLAYALSCQLWEEAPELALKLDEPAGQLQHSLVAWLKQAREESSKLDKLTLEYFLTDSQKVALNERIDG
ncbi:hypothetical protein [Xenorhabdus griffiniae]|uniref:hypothetical protein n=1 Tax=Xenorhabdus griffiniae TaxID=351672 RepID=UPI002359F20A|nr:hypothetical protein [Xenorhabdus griffiniae]MDC9605233.1 hypothetical protein [Xenorhabdus griffiniae]